MRVAGGMLALLGVMALGGGMLFFGAVMAPLVFTHLPLPVAGPFIRAAFPWYYGYCIATAALVALGLWLRRDWRASLVPVAVLLVTCWLWFHLLPMLDAARLAHQTAQFARGHKLSVWLNGAELLAVIMLALRLGARLR